VAVVAGLRVSASCSLVLRLRRETSSVRKGSFLALFVSSRAPSVCVVALRLEVRGSGGRASSAPPFRFTVLAGGPCLVDGSTCLVEVDEVSCSFLGDSLGFLASQHLRYSWLVTGDGHPEA
jgi:hypothetical protein